MVRVTSSTMVSGSSIYSYLDIDGLGTNATSSNYSLAGGVTSAYNWDNYNCTSTLKWWENGVGYDITSGSGSYEGYTDMQLASYSPFSVPRTNVTRYITFECYTTCPGGSGSAQYTVEVPHLPGAPTSLSATRISDNRIDLTWTNPSSTYGGFYLQVSIDGGAWSNAWSVENVMPTSYSYTAASAGHSYKFRAYTGYWYAYSSYSNETATISMTPTAPTAISVAAVSGTTVEVTLTNPSPVATKVQYQVSTDGGSTWGATQESANITTFQTTVSGTGKIRVRNYNSTGTSAWLVSDTITTITPPAAPTLTAPAGSIIDLALGSVDFEWVFNSLDGSAQTAYEFDYSINGVSQTPKTGTTAKKETVSLSTLSAGDTITVKVRTKGADANWGAWSSTKTYNVYSAPTVSITSPAATITGMPISLAATYSDMAGFSCVYAHASLTQGGRVLFDEDATISGSSISASLDVSEFLPTNGESYTVVLEVRSSSSLQSSANATFLVSFTEPKAGELQVTNDADTGYASLLATFEQTQDILGGSVWELGSMRTSNGEPLESTTVARLTDTVGVDIGTDYTVTGTGLAVNVHYYINGVWKTCDGVWNDLPYTFNTGKYDGIRMVTKYTGGGDIDLGDIDLVCEQTYMHGKNLAHYTLKGYISGSTTTNVSIAGLNGSGGTLVVAKLDANTDYTFHVEPYTGSNRCRCVLLETSPLDQTAHAASTCEYLNWVDSFDSPYTVSFNSESYGWLLFGASNTSTAYNPDIVAQLEYGGEFTGYEPYDNLAIPQSISVARVNADGSLTPLITDGASGAGVVDKYAPLNKAYQYAVTTKAASQAVKTVYVDNEIVTDLWFAYWGDNIASAKWNPDNGGIQLSRPQKTRVYYAGRKDPVSYDGAAVALSETPSWIFVEQSEVEPFVQLIEDGGRGVYKSCDGWVYHADFDLTLNPKYIAIGYYGGMMLSITRIAGEQL